MCCVLVAGLWLTQGFRARTSSQQSLLTFAGYTNLGLHRPRSGVHYERFAAFRLSNASPVRVNYFAESVDVFTEAGWQTNGLRATPTPTNWPYFGAAFGPGESLMFYVPPPSNSKWRIRLRFQEHARGWRGYRDRFDDYMANRGRTVTRETFTGRTYEVSSIELTQ